MTLGNDDVIGGGAGPVEMPTLTVTGPDAEPHPDVPGHTRHRRLWPRRQQLGRPRVSTLVLMSVWVAALALYLEIRPV
ncbi:hypothetical protein [Nocardia macrotermitis]|uniref:Uncharacterized protein n=1 Tax=Nocardia macrotermitis TaxID=2585198 RepID=A0A7K0DAU8_9NOCA|nr:hypothetical protein [Nocardia macrotermitis]MQY22808.1 hypothetical protein [Nocardia macrotermitis]